LLLAVKKYLPGEDVVADAFNAGVCATAYNARIAPEKHTMIVTYGW